MLHGLFSRTHKYPLQITYFALTPKIDTQCYQEFFEIISQNSDNYSPKFIWSNTDEMSTAALNVFDNVPNKTRVVSIFSSINDETKQILLNARLEFKSYKEPWKSTELKIECSPGNGMYNFKSAIISCFRITFIQSVKRGEGA